MHHSRIGRATARGARLRYVRDDDAGYRRVRCGRGFTYRDWKGRVVSDEKLRERFASLVIPPAWTEVWICRHANGHIQATGRDDAGRKQYLYHPRWREARDRAKYSRIVDFGKLLPKIRARVARDLRRRRLTRDRVIAAIVSLLESSFARVGNEEYARANGSYGLTTLRKKHVKEQGSALSLEFKGKGAKQWAIEIGDSRVASVIRECMEAPGRALFKYYDDDGRERGVTANDVNQYLQVAAEARVTAKDFRTWAGTVLAATALQEAEATTKREVVRAVEAVAAELGNTPSIARNCYVHPEVIDGFSDGELHEHELQSEIDGLKPEEASVLAFLEHRSKKG